MIILATITTTITITTLSPSEAGRPGLRLVQLGAALVRPGCVIIIIIIMIHCYVTYYYCYYYYYYYYYHHYQ